ncbi:thymidine kinase [Longirhabdus pacifica]|uniref:thymidine kinase n=1 Tax=Longirhabdus pacifica TaxID=2305227 RepID=UPI00100918E7|nr:thymidine kinase [Longirhabdus pacifica]
MAQLYFRYGTMNSSKSAQLLMVNHNYEEQGKKTIIFKPALDTRDGKYVKSRALIGNVTATIIQKEDKGEMFQHAKSIMPDCVLVDEAQWLHENHIDELTDIVDELSIPVICYGLLTDFQGHLFDGSRRLLEVADKREEVKTVCRYCNKKAMFNMRVFEGEPIFHGEQLQVGGNESYIPVCRKCFKDRKQKWESNA